MNEAEFERFVAESQDELRRKNAALSEEFGLGGFARWDHDGEAAVLTFSNPGDPVVLEAGTTSIGSYSLNSKTWLWAWANQSLIEREREKAAELRQLFQTTRLRIFSDPHLDCDEYLAWELVATSVRHLDSLGCYRAPSGHLLVFLSIDSVAKARRAK